MRCLILILFSVSLHAQDTVNYDLPRAVNMLIKQNISQQQQIDRLTMIVDSMLNPSDMVVYFSQDFEQDPLGFYTYDRWVSDWFEYGTENNYIWGDRWDKVEIVQDGSKVMKAYYPKGTVGPGQGGFQWQPLVPALDSVYFSYNVKIKPGFNWAYGGKLPGIGGTPNDYGPGEKPSYTSGFSLGLLFGYGYAGQDDKGAIYNYFYNQNQSGRYGDVWRWGTFKFDDKWHNLTIYVKMNDIGKSNGVIRNYIDGVLVAEKTNAKFRSVSSVHADYMKIYSHFGGSGQDYAAQQDEWIEFDDFTLFNFKSAVGDTIKFIKH